MPKTTLPFDVGGYAPVADRIALFYARHPTGRIITELIERGEVVLFRALVYRAQDDAQPAATGWASERVGDGEINTVACVENTETSAIGRALANLGFTASNRRPSAEEMGKASRERVRLARERLNPLSGQLTPRDPWVEMAYGAASTERARWGLRSDPIPADAVVTEAAALVRNADAPTIDALDLLNEAIRAGMDAGRASRLRVRLQSGSVAEPVIERVERMLRRWLVERERVVMREPGPAAD